MELQFAFQKTEWIGPDDFRAKKIEQLEELRGLVKTDPLALVVHLLESHGGSMTGDALEKELSGAVIPEASFKKWWDATKKALRESRLAAVPQKRTEAIVLRVGDRSPAEALVADFEAARDIKGMIRALEAIAADIGAFENDTEALKRLLSDIDEGAKKAARVQLGQALQLVAARDEVIGSSKALELDPIRRPPLGSLAFRRCPSVWPKKPARCHPAANVRFTKRFRMPSPKTGSAKSSRSSTASVHVASLKSPASCRSAKRCPPWSPTFVPPSPAAPWGRTR